jgi:hypothetical protein
MGCRCRICSRLLKNPVSIEAGMGPVCRAKNNTMQGEFDFMKAEWEVLKHESGKYILIRDIGHNSGRTVTNDAEYVINQLFVDEGITEETRVFYEDSEGRIDELLHSGKKHTGYKAGHEGVEL